MKFNYLLLIVSLLGMSFIIQSQTQYSAYTAIGKGVATPYLRDYQSLGINNSALGWGTGYENKNTVLGMTEFAVGISSPTLDRDRMRNAAQGLYNNLTSNSQPEVDWDRQREAAADYAQSGVAINADYNWFGGYFYNEKFGGIALSIRENYNWYSRLNDETTDIIFRGKLSNYFDSLQIVINGDTSMIANNMNIGEDTLNAVISGRLNNPVLLSELTNGSDINFRWNREYNFGYGRRILGNDSTLAIYGGVGGRFIQSVAMVDFRSNDDGVEMNSSLSPFFGIDYGAIETTNPSAVLENNGIFPDISGMGYGLDFAASVILMKKIRIAASVNNIGSVTYKSNVYSVRDTLFSEITIPGLNDDDITQSLDQILTTGSIMTLEGREELVLPNAANFRLGGSIDFIDQVSLGVDIVAPFDRTAPGSLQNAVISVGGDFKPVKWLQLSAGYFGGGVYRHNIPLGINFILKDGAYEFGFASRDAFSFFSNNSNALSFAMGFARIRF